MLRGCLRSIFEDDDPDNELASKGMIRRHSCMFSGTMFNHAVLYEIRPGWNWNDYVTIPHPKSVEF